MSRFCFLLGRGDSLDYLSVIYFIFRIGHGVGVGVGAGVGVDQNPGVGVGVGVGTAPPRLRPLFFYLWPLLAPWGSTAH